MTPVKKRYIRKFKKGSIGALGIKFFYRPFWWKYRYMRWVVVGNRKHNSRKKKYYTLWPLRRLCPKEKILFRYKTLKERAHKFWIFSRLKRKFLNIESVTKSRTLEKALLNFHCVLNLKQAQTIVDKGWALVNGRVSKNRKLVLKRADIVTLAPFVWKRLAEWFYKLYPRKKQKKKYNRRIKIKKRKYRKKKYPRIYKNFPDFLLFRKINSLSYVTK